jgi:hypothetical protein
MKSFGNITSNDYTVFDFDASAPINWTLASSSLGNLITSPVGLDGAVTITRATNNPIEFFTYSDTRAKNIETDTFEHVLYSSIKQMFYNNTTFVSSSVYTTESLSPLTDNSYVVSIGQEFYGEGIRPGSFGMRLTNVSTVIQDDGYGNLFVIPPGEGQSYIGNVFYDQGVAVIKHDVDATTTSVTANGLKIIEGTETNVVYQTNYKIYRHEIKVKLPASSFNFSIANPSVRQSFDTQGDLELEEELQDLNIPTSGSAGEWPIYRLMQAGIIKPYVTTIGLYNDRNELLAVAKLSTPIQRTFEADQLFIVRFDV